MRSNTIPTAVCQDIGVYGGKHVYLFGGSRPVSLCLQTPDLNTEEKTLEFPQHGDCICHNIAWKKYVADLGYTGLDGIGRLILRFLWGESSIALHIP